MERVGLEFTAESGWVVLRPLCGHDEEAVAGATTEEAIRLLDRLLVGASGAALGPGCAAKLAAPDRDRLLVAVYRATFGPRIESTLICGRCDASFELDFQLDELAASLREAEALVREAGAVFRMPDGRRFRLPTGQDELEVLELAPDRREPELLARCLVEGRAEDAGPVLEAMRAVGPLVDTDLDARCPECGATETVHFDLQYYLLNLIQREAPLRTLEIHRLARAYGWSLGDILSLRRRQRRELSSHIDREPSPR